MENMLALLTEQKEVSHLPRAFFFIVEFILDHVYSDAVSICGNYWGLGFDVAFLFKGYFSFGEYI